METLEDKLELAISYLDLGKVSLPQSLERRV